MIVAASSDGRQPCPVGVAHLVDHLGQVGELRQQEPGGARDHDEGDDGAAVDPLEGLEFLVGERDLGLIVGVIPGLIVDRARDGRRDRSRDRGVVVSVALGHLVLQFSSPAARTGATPEVVVIPCDAIRDRRTQESAKRPDHPRSTRRWLPDGRSA